MAIIGMLDDIQSTIGRLQSNGGLFGELINVAREGNSASLDVPLTMENQNPQSAVYNSATSGCGQRFPIASFPSISGNGAYVIRGLKLRGYIQDGGADLQVQFIDTTSSTVLTTVVVPVASLPATEDWFDVPLATPIYHTPEHAMDIRCYCPTAGAGGVRLMMNLNAQPLTAGSYYISTTDGWNTTLVETGDDLCFILDIEKATLSGEIAIPMLATAVERWGQMFFVSEGSVACAIEDEGQNVLIASLDSGGSMAAVDPKKRLVARFTLTRAQASDPSPVLYEPSWTWIGAPPLLFSSKVQASGNPSSGSVTILEIYGSGHCVLVCNGNSSTTYNTSFQIEIDDQPGFSLSISDAVAAAPLFPLRFTHHLRISGSKNNSYTQAVATID